MNIKPILFNTNTVEVIGLLQNGLYLSHEKMGEKFYAGTLKVKRLSGAEDLLPVTIPGRLYEQAQAIENGPIQITGQLRTYNKVIGNKGRLFINIHAQSIAAAQASTLNEVQLTGTLCKQPVYRVTPFGREICDMMLAVNRGYGKSDYIPVITWGGNAKRASTLRTGDRITLSGRIQSRDYEKKLATGDSITRTAYEVSAFRLGLEGAA